MLKQAELITYQRGKGNTICGIYGVCLEESTGPDEFEYLIADNYDPSAAVTDGKGKSG